ncbi:hypothetical protein ABS755_10340 [Castellaniella sp. FW104-16D08]|uniref:hypothetical protein n=1 Tax=unclassified Castellaniella TaxID=2617606 RepID=UPI0033152E00
MSDKPKKPIYKRVWFWLVMFFVLPGVISGLTSDKPSKMTGQTEAAKIAAAPDTPSTDTAETTKAKEEERLKKLAAKTKEDTEKAAAKARLYAISFGEMAIKQSLRDPDSLQWEWKAVNLDNGALCYLYRAKNGFGGYNREGTVIVDGKSYTSNAQWNKYCGKTGNYEEY